MSTDNFTIERMSFGEKLKAFRKSNKLTLQQMSAIIGVSNGFLSEVENNKKMPGGEVLIALKRNFCISLDFLLSDDTSSPPLVTEPEHPYEPEPLPQDEWDLLRRFRKLDDQNKKNLLHVLSGFEALSEGGVERGSAVSGSEGNSFSRKLKG